MVERFGEYIIEQSVSVSAVQELSMVRGVIYGKGCNIFKGSISMFCLLVLFTSWKIA